MPFSVPIVVRKLGRAITLDLTEALKGFSFCEVESPHMTLLFKQKGFGEQEINYVKQLLRQKYGESEVQFNLRPWGPRSDLVKGDLEALCLYIRDEFRKASGQNCSPDRPPHVELRRKSAHL